MSEREAFEAWIKQHPDELSIERWPQRPDEYLSTYVQMAWEAWRASVKRKAKQ